MRVESCGALLTLIATTETDAEARYLVRALELLEANRDPGARIELIADPLGEMYGTKVL